MSYIKHMYNTAVAGQVASHLNLQDLKMTIDILEYTELAKDIPRSSSTRYQRELIWIHRLNIIIANGTNILDLGNKFRRS